MKEAPWRLVRSRERLMRITIHLKSLSYSALEMASTANSHWKAEAEDKVCVYLCVHEAQRLNPPNLHSLLGDRRDDQSYFNDNIMLHTLSSTRKINVQN